VHFGLLSPPCTFPGIQIIRHSAYRFFLHFLRLRATFSLGYVRRHIQPAFLAVFCRIRYIYCRLLRLARRLLAHVTLVESLGIERQFFKMKNA